MVFPNDDTQPEFGQALIRAAKAGVEVACYGCHVEADSIKITGCVGRYSPICLKASAFRHCRMFESKMSKLMLDNPIVQ